MIRVAVLGATGRMGHEVAAAVSRAEDLELVVAWDRSSPGRVIATAEDRPEQNIVLTDRLDALADAGAEVAVDFTHPAAVLEHARWCLGNGIHIVIGTSGITSDGLAEIRERAEAGDANAFIAPNFAMGAVLMMRFAEQAARHFDAAEVIELHHDGKVDAPSSTAIATAQRIAAGRAEARNAPGGDDAHPGARGADIEGIRVHGVRLPGLLAHQEVIFGSPGETLTIRHDSTDRTSFIPGVLMAVRSVATRPGLTVGLDALLDAP
jgi:4-hydroxy-tetrahydrodipicolinate reductase